MNDEYVLENCTAPIDMDISQVQQFNLKNKLFLKKVVKELFKEKMVKGVTFYRLNYGVNDAVSIVEKNFNSLDGICIVDENLKGEHRYIQYYWIEFNYSGQVYKVAMFYKDFDRNSGNLHVLPGMVQVWKKREDNGEVSGKGMLIVCCKRTSGYEQEPKGESTGGKPYSELEWIPVITKKSATIKMIWQEAPCEYVGYIMALIRSDMPEITKFEKSTDTDKCLGKCAQNMYPLELRKEIYGDKCGTGRKNTYSFLKFFLSKKDQVLRTRYAIRYVKGIGYIYLFDGCERRYKLQSEKSPNRLCVTNENEKKIYCWEIMYVEEKGG